MPTLKPSYTTLDDQPEATIHLDRVTRWEVYHRLTALEIPCQCRVNQPLQVRAETPTAIVQMWSVIQACTAPQVELVNHLNRCWQQRITR
jgi:hypothetical protein